MSAAPETIAQPPTAGTDAGGREADSLSVAEMLRIMDVASTLRRERELVEREFAIDEVKAGLRRKLRDVAETTGEPIRDEEVEAAIDWYYRNLHEFREPRPSLSLFLAHLYVRRTAILGWTLATLAVLALVWWWTR